jgi:putative 4-mercaptohistidine N1-methyltranferase
MNFYETDRAVAEYLLFHYGSPEQLLPYAFGPQNALNFPARCVTECLDRSRLSSSARTLDLGCAVGRAAFELARFCTQAIGIDYSRRFIETACHLQKHGSIDFECVEEGELTRRGRAIVPDEINRQRVDFELGDGMNLRDDLGTFDVVLMANLIDRVSNPRRCLQRMPVLVKSGGQLIITSPYTWLEQYTPKENWLGGLERDGHEIKTFETLKLILSPAFELSFAKDLPFLIREHARKFQWSVAEASVWIRK